MNGQALHIGINYCNPHDAADCQLDGAIPDALALRDATDRLEFGRLNGNGILLEAEATESGILEAVRTAADNARSGELLLVTFSGLGVGPDLSNTLEDLLGLRGWVTYDRKVVDVNEILGALSGAPKGATVLVVSACCFIGPRLGASALRTRGAVGTTVLRPRMSSRRFDRFLRSTGEQTLFDRFAMRAMTEGPNGTSRVSAGSATIYHLAACGIDETIPDGTFSVRSPFAGALIDLTASGIAPPFEPLVTALQNVLDPDPQLEKFPDDPIFSREEFYKAMGMATELQPV